MATGGDAAFALTGLADTALDAPLPSREVFQRVLAQRARLLSLVTPLEDAALVVESMHGREALSACYAFDIDCLAPNAHLELRQLVGEEITLRLLLADGRTRSWHGMVTQIAQLGADGSLARYRLRIEPWLVALAHRRCSRLFQDKTVQDILAEIFAAVPGAQHGFELTQTLAPRSLCVQYRETDFDFVSRLLASEGLSYRFEHAQDGAALQGGHEAQGHSQHRLVVFDAGGALADCPQAAIRFHRNDATEASDCIQAWRAQQAILPNHFVRAGWDYKPLLAHAGNAELNASAYGGPGRVPPLEDYDAGTVYRYANAREAERAARLAADYHALATAPHRIAGTVRQLAAGQRFTLTEHPHYHGDGARFHVLEVEHAAANNLEGGARRLAPPASPRQPAQGLGENALSPLGAERGAYRNRALCVAAALPIVPAPRPKPSLTGMQTALVVGPPRSEPGTGTHSERDGRVKIQFPWQRGPNPLPGGLVEARERATANDTNGTWVRLAELQAGPNWGSTFTPRLGTEVLVDFLVGDPDRPVIVGQLYNGEDAPPWPAC